MRKDNPNVAGYNTGGAAIKENGPADLLASAIERLTCVVDEALRNADRLVGDSAVDSSTSKGLASAFGGVFGQIETAAAILHNQADRLDSANARITRAM